MFADLDLLLEMSRMSSMMVSRLLARPDTVSSASLRKCQSASSTREHESVLPLLPCQFRFERQGRHADDSVHWGSNFVTRNRKISITSLISSIGLSYDIFAKNSPTFPRI